jgi:hypothetical protein
MVKYLVEKGAEIDNAVLLARIMGHLEIVKFLEIIMGN